MPAPIINWTKFKRPPPTTKYTTIELRKIGVEKLLRKRAVLSEVACYIIQSENTLVKLFGNLSKDEFGNVDIKEIHGFLCATGALNASPRELKTAMILINKF